MPPARLIGVIALGVMLLWVRPGPAAAQSELQMWLNPEMGKQIPRADYRYTFYPERKVEDQDAHFAMTEQRVSLFAPFYQDSKDEWAFSAKTLYQDIDTRARFPEAGGVFPSELWDASATVSYRHRFDNSWTGGVALTVGSASDEPFNTVDEMYFRLITLLRVPQGERNSWIFTLIYATDEQIFGQTLPIPGIAYAWVPSDKFTAVIGFPFSMIRYKPFENLTLEAEYYPFWTVRSRATWEIFQPLRAYVGFQWDSDHFYRADRDGYDFVYQTEQGGDVVVPVADHGGTHIQVDGQSVESHSLFNMVGFTAPAGRHQVEISFGPTAVYVQGAMLSLAGVIGGLVGLVFWNGRAGYAKNTGSQAAPRARAGRLPVPRYD